jgi:hypothetical protein
LHPFFYEDDDFSERIQPPIDTGQQETRNSLHGMIIRKERIGTDGFLKNEQITKSQRVRRTQNREEK